MRGFRFDCFSLDPSDRQLLQRGKPVELSSRYFDALVLLVSEQGRLIGKDRFMDEVWRGVPVTDEALTQCIRTLRRQLGDSAASPRFIETVPKHGYRFIASVEAEESTARSAPVSQMSSRQQLLSLARAGTLGGAVAGLIGGLFYGFGAALAEPSGALSVVVVLLVATTAVASIGAAGVSFGAAGARALARRSRSWTIVGAAAGGLVIGAIVKLLGLDAITILFGRSPGAITGAGEGLALGTAIGLGASLQTSSLRSRIALAALIGAAAGILVSFAGGHLMGGSLAALAEHFPGSRLRLDNIAALLGEHRFGAATQMVTAALEASLFSACVVGAIALQERIVDENAK